MTFNDMGLSQPVLKALARQGYTQPTEVQQRAIPALLDGRDLLASAQTGTGKTAAFAIPIIEQLLRGVQPGGRRPIRALVVTPTRELAIQVADNIKAYSRYTPLRTTTIYGGVRQHQQVRDLRQGVDVLVATPGRLLDLINQGHVKLASVEHLVLDEADQMLDMGFIHDIRRIIALVPTQRQSLFFSATLPPAIVRLSKQILGEQPERIVIKPEQTTAERVSQSVYFVSRRSKLPLLLHLLKGDEEKVPTLVFSRTRHGADKLARRLGKQGIAADAIHGNRSQAQRQKTLRRFREGRTQVLVATDVAARGIDVAGLSRVINYDMPDQPEVYVHRIGRTGRAACSGEALSFCGADERKHLAAIQKLIGQQIPVAAENPYQDDAPAPRPERKKKPWTHRARSRSRR